MNLANKDNSSKTTRSLYNAKEVQEIRTLLLQSQKGLDAVTGLPVSSTSSVLDHDHQTQYVRGVLDRQINVFLGKIENSYIRYIKYWYKDDLSTLLNQLSAYLSKTQSEEYVHPSWLKRVKIDFNKLKVQEQDRVLEVLLGTIPTGGYKNSTKRKETFNKILLTKQYDYSTILELIQEVKNNKGE